METTFPLSFGQLSMRGDFFLDESNPNDVYIPFLVDLEYPTPLHAVKHALHALETQTESLRSRIVDYLPRSPYLTPMQQVLEPRDDIPLTHCQVNVDLWDEVASPSKNSVTHGYCWSAIFLYDDEHKANALKIWVNHLFSDMEGLSLIRDFIIDYLHEGRMPFETQHMRDYVDWEKQRWDSRGYSQKVIHRWSEAIRGGELRPLHALDEYVVASKRIHCAEGYLEAIQRSGMSILGQTLTALINTRQYRNMPLAMLVECSNRRFPINRNLVCTATQHGLFTCEDARKLMENNRDMTALLPALRYAWYDPTPVLEMLPDCLLLPEFTLPWNVNVAYPNCPCPYADSKRNSGDDADIHLEAHQRLKGSIAHYVSVTVWTDVIDVYWSRSILGDVDDMRTFISSLESSIRRYSGRRR